MRHRRLTATGPIPRGLDERILGDLGRRDLDVAAALGELLRELPTLQISRVDARAAEEETFQVDAVHERRRHRSSQIRVVVQEDEFQFRAFPELIRQFARQPIPLRAELDEVLHDASVAGPKQTVVFQPQNSQQFSVH